MEITAAGRPNTSLAPVRPSPSHGVSCHRVEPAVPCAVVRSDRRSDFIAHLVATRDDAEQTRLRRRAGSDEATLAYRGASRLLERFPRREVASA